MGGLSKAHIKEDVTICFVHAVAAQCGINFETPRRDNDSIDAVISYSGSCSQWVWSSPSIGIQLKATASHHFDDKGNLVFRLPIKNFNDLSRKTQAPRLLVVLALNHKDDFVKIQTKNLLIDGIAYWISLEGYKTTSRATTSITIRIPSKNVLTIETILRMIHNVGCDRDVATGL